MPVSSSVYEMAGVVQDQVLMQAPGFITVKHDADNR